MRARLQSWWYDIKESLWFLPAILTAAAVALAFLTVRLDQTLLLDRRAKLSWVFGGGAKGARGVLEAIAGTMITVTALVFSITVVALQLASSQLSPRVLRTFMADRDNQTVLGFFIGTFTFALLVLRVVRSPVEGSGGFIPSLSVTVSIVLVLLSVALLIYFVHHAANTMRASVVIDRAARATRDLIIRRYPEYGERTAQTCSPGWLDSLPTGSVRAEESGYLQTINVDGLFELAEQRDLTILATPRIGAFVLSGAMLASVWPADALDDGIARSVRKDLVLGPERTLRSDVGLGLQQLSDIAVKALSPGINDPTTAIICIDRLSEGIALLASRDRPDEARCGPNGEARVVVREPSFASWLGWRLTRSGNMARGIWSSPRICSPHSGSLRRSFQRNAVIR